MNEKLEGLTFFNGQIFMWNNGFNPHERDPVVTYLDSNFLLPFSIEISSALVVLAGTYEIRTDTGMTPFVAEEVLTGFFISDKFITNFFRVENGTGTIFSAFIGIGNSHMEMERSYGKYDDALAYVGGLFGLVIGFFAFFLMSFNEYRYELFVSEAFSFKKDDQVKEEDFHFLKYVKYVIYD